MAVGGSAEFHADFEPLLFKPLLIEPVLQDADKSVLEKRLSEFDALLAGRSDEIAGLVVEPLVQGAAGMWMHDPVWLRAICSKAREHKIPVVFDEVFTGMGRLGTPFAAQRLGFAPDLLCLAKGLTAGAASMALTLATKAIFDCFDGDDASSAFLHGHTFTGHAVACAASLASLRVYDQENLVGKAAELESCYLDWIQKNQSKDCIQNARACGSVLAFEVSRAGDAAGSGYFSDPRQKQKLMQAGLESGLFLRPLGATVYLTPPLSVNPEELLLRLDQSIERYLKT
jgi:adenosylmethionine-8-amino-7-oxononanoate aminotransferase